MTRLQKKCLFAAAGTHLFVVVAVLCSGFVRPKPAVDNTPILTLLSLPTTDKATSGESTPVTPPPAAAPTPPPPTPPIPVVKPPPEPQPDPPKVEQLPIVKPTEVTPPEQTEEDKTSDVPKPPPKKKREHPINVDTSKVVTRSTPKVRDTSEEDDAKAEVEAAKEAKRLLDQKRRAINNALSTLTTGLTTATKVTLQGTSSASFANYGTFVAAVYHHAWIAPVRMATDSAVVTFSVTVARDGSVVSSHIENSSDDSSVDEAVQRMLNRVTFIHEFPEDSTDRERTFHIDFKATKTTQ